MSNNTHVTCNEALWMGPQTRCSIMWDVIWMFDGGKWINIGMYQKWTELDHPRIKTVAPVPQSNSHKMPIASSCHYCISTLIHTWSFHYISLAQSLYPSSNRINAIKLFHCADFLTFALKARLLPARYLFHLPYLCIHLCPHCWSCACSLRCLCLHRHPWLAPWSHARFSLAPAGHYCNGKSSPGRYRLAAFSTCLIWGWPMHVRVVFLKALIRMRMRSPFSMSIRQLRK